MRRMKQVGLFLVFLVLLPICSNAQGDFNSSKETFGEHKWKEHLAGKDEVHFPEIDDRLIESIAIVESGNNPQAVGKAGEIGSCQISEIVIKEYADWVNKENCGVPLSEARHFTTWGKEEWKIDKYNKDLCKWYLNRLKTHYLKDKYTIERLLIAWNWGIGNLRKVNYDVSKCPKSVREYVRKVLKEYKEEK